MTNEIKFTRQQLYELVWSKPVHQLAPLYNLSDVGFAKTCRRYLIPLPPRGSWRRRELGYTVKATPLPKWNGEREPLIVFYPAESPCQERQAKASPGDTFEQLPENRIVVPAELPEKPHKFVKHTAALLRRAKPGLDGLLTDADAQSFVVAVGRDSVGRALRILQALCEAFEKRGYELAASVPPSRGVRVVINGQPLLFSVEERLRRYPHTPTKSEIDANRRDGRTPIRKWAHEPNAVLAFKILGIPWQAGAIVGRIRRPRHSRTG